MSDAFGDETVESVDGGQEFGGRWGGRWRLGTAGCNFAVLAAT